jgi:meiotically up-regulated gene 157 (Mug157) protein
MGPSLCLVVLLDLLAHQARQDLQDLKDQRVQLVRLVPKVLRVQQDLKVQSVLHQLSQAHRGRRALLDRQVPRVQPALFLVRLVQQVRRV